MEFAILSSSVVERSTVNRLVVGSNPTWGVSLNSFRVRLGWFNRLGSVGSIQANCRTIALAIHVATRIQHIHL